MDTYKQQEIRLDGLRELASLSIKENTVQDTGAKVLSECYNAKSLYGEGAFTFMSQLMRNCEKHQVKEVVRLFEEFMPNMFKGAMECLIRERIHMHARHFQSKELNRCLHTLTARWKKQDKVREEFHPLKAT